MSRIYHYSESNGESSRTGDTNYGTKLSLTFTPDASSTYFAFGSSQINYSAAAEVVKLRMSNGATVYSNPTPTTINATDYFAYGAVGVLVNPVGDQTIDIQWGCGGATRTAYIKNARIVAIKKDAADQYTQVASFSTTLNSYQDAAALTFTPATQGDYLVICVGDVAQSASGVCVYAQANFDGTGFGEAIYDDGAAGSTYNQWTCIRRANLTAVSHTIKVQIRRGATGTAYIQNLTIIALRLDTFDGNYYAEVTARATTTSSTFQDFVTLTQDLPGPADYLIFSCGCPDNSAQASSSPNSNLLEGSTTEIDAIFRGRQIARNQGSTACTVYRGQSYSGSKTWKQQFRSPNNTQSVGMANSSITVLKMTTSEATQSVEQSTGVHRGMGRGMYRGMAA